MKLNITYSAYRELELIPQAPLRHIGEAIIALAENPYPAGSSLLQGIGGCYYLAIDNYYILYQDRKSTRLNSSHGYISYAVFCLKKKNINSTTSSLVTT